MDLMDDDIVRGWLVLRRGQMQNPVVWCRMRYTDWGSFWSSAQMISPISWQRL